MPRIEANTPAARGMLEELAKEEAALQQALLELRAAFTKREVAERRFAAIRDATASLIEGNPFHPSVRWPDSRRPPFFRGEFRFARMNTLDAVEWALGEAKEPQTVAQLAETLSNGGLAATPRSVNASLLQAKRVERLDGPNGEAVYQLRDRDEGEVESDEMPF